jgi:hypothetical protein
MESSFHDVKAALHAFRDTVIGCLDRKATPEDDTRFANEFDVVLIVFNADARLLWHSKNSNGVSFSDAVNGMRASGATNMGDALKLSFQSLNTKMFDYGVILLMTDGFSNNGPCQKPFEFRLLVSQNKHPNVKLFAMGFGAKFDSETLKAIGDYHHIPEREFVSMVIGGIIGEINTTFGMVCAQ